MENSGAVKDDSKASDSWIRRNVVDVAPLWAQFIQTAFANVRITLDPLPETGLTPSKESSG